MKKHLIIFIFFICYDGKSQIQNNLNSTLEQLRNSTTYIQCKTFKNKIEKQAVEAGKNATNNKQLLDLEATYNSTWKKFDLFLKRVKRDLIDNENSDDEIKSNEYLALLSDTKKEYEQNFMPVYNEIIGGKRLIDNEFVNLGIDLVKTFFQNIKAKKRIKNEAVNSILPKLNKYFFDNLKLKTFSELDILPSFSNSISEKRAIIPESTLDSLEGSIEFIEMQNLQEKPMEFEMNSGKDIIVDSASNSTYKSPYFTSLNSYPIGSKFKINTNSTVFIYAVVLNSDGVKFLFPDVRYSQIGKDIEVTIEESAKNGSKILPSKGLFTITKSKVENENNSEDFAIIISKSELILEETIEKINLLSGQLDERFSQVFSDHQITYDEASLQNIGSKFTFSYPTGEKNILPIVFKILK